MSTSNASRMNAAAAIAADILALTALITLGPGLAERLSDPSGYNTLIIGLSFVVFAVGVYLLRRLQVVAGGSEWQAPRTRGVLGLVFALSIMTMLAWQLGFFESMQQVNTREMGEGAVAVYYVFAPGAWLGFSLLYIIILAFHVTPTVSPEQRYVLTALIGLVATGLMLVITTAQMRAMLGDQAGIGWGALALGWLVVLFLPPRMIFARRAIGHGRWATIAAASLVVLSAIGAIWIILS